MLADDEYLCGYCGKCVCDDDMGIQCEGKCEFWYRCKCIEMSVDEYRRLTDSDVIWKCSACIKGLPPFNSIEAVDVFHFDFMKNLPTPKLTVGEQFYQRLLWTYLFGIYSSSTQLMTALILCGMSY